MDKLRIQGGKPLRGEVAISGAKNAILPLMAACLLLDGPFLLENIAELGDVLTMAKLLKQMGVTVEEKGSARLQLNANTLTHTFAPYEMVRAMRASILVLGPMLARFGSAQVSMPGGCAIGARPVDRHLQALKAMGANIEIENGYIKAQGKLHGAEVGFDDHRVVQAAHQFFARCGQRIGFGSGEIPAQIEPVGKDVDQQQDNAGQGHSCSTG